MMPRSLLGMDETRAYALGDSADEHRRLMLQSRFIDELTEPLFTRAGLAEGMRVLDVGCGVGDVSLLAGRFVGASGSVLGVDRSGDSIDLARRRAASAGLHNLRFEQSALEELHAEGPFDALVGRLILLYLPDPAQVLQQLASLVRPGGLIIFQEMDMLTGRSLPPVPLYERVGHWITTTFQRAGVDIEMGSRLFETYRRAGLPAPQLLSGARAMGGACLELCAWQAGTLGSLLPLAEKLGVCTRDEVQIETLASRIGAEIAAGGGSVHAPVFVGAWSRLPG
ncbi:MAG TPA: class I SAM-dependent methyltransferase [Polyangiaceae bacterium]|nr:class I SAM-dependent methyltransferase [Polyangiaceae bacterium]